MTSAVARLGNRRRAADLRERRASAGLVQVTLWVPVRCKSDLEILASMLRADADLSVGPARRVSSGRFVRLGD